MSRDYHGSRIPKPWGKGRGKKVKTVKHGKSGTEVTIYLDSTDLVFGAVYLDEVVQDKDGAVVEKRILEIIAKAADLTWFPVILIYDDDGKTTHHHGRREIFYETISLAMERFYLAIKKDNTIRRVDWDIPADIRLDNSEDYWLGREYVPPLVLPYSHGDEQTLIHYDEATWIGLQDIHSKVRQLRISLRNLIRTEQGLKQIASVGAKGLLPAPGESGKKTK